MQILLQFKIQGEEHARDNRVKDNPKIKYNEAMNLKIDLIPFNTSISYRATGTAINYLSKETNPNISILGMMRII